MRYRNDQNLPRIAPFGIVRGRSVCEGTGTFPGIWHMAFSAWKRQDELYVCVRIYVAVAQPYLALRHDSLNRIHDTFRRTPVAFEQVLSVIRILPSGIPFFSWWSASSGGHRRSQFICSKPQFGQSSYVLTMSGQFRHPVDGILISERVWRIILIWPHCFFGRCAPVPQWISWVVPLSSFSSPWMRPLPGI